jgi:DNA-binding response OmpR family regulator
MNSSLTNLPQPVLGDSEVDPSSERFRVLIVEDDAGTLFLIKQILTIAGFEVFGSSNGLDGLKKVSQVNPDIMLLDLMMPEIDGWQVLTRLRQVSALPVIIISAVDRKEDIVRALHLGADDYITKPVHNNEVVERIHAVMRRIAKPNDTRLYFAKQDLLINLKTREVIYHGKMVDLTPKEFSILASLARRAPNMVTHETIRMEIWGQDSADLQNRVKYLVFSLRQKFDAIVPKSHLITTVNCKGYRLKVDQS